MKPSAIALRSGRREPTVAGKLALALAGLGVLTGFVLFLWIGPQAPSGTNPVPSPGRPLVTRPNSGGVATLAETDVAALPPAILALDQPTEALPAGITVAQFVTEISLPAPPSGDFELNPTAEEISAIVEKRYGALFQTLGLPPEQLARLRWLLVERQQTTVDAANAALLTGVNPVRELATVRSAIEEEQAIIDTNLRHELGESVFNAYCDYDRTLGERNLVGDFSRLLAATGEPPPPELERQVMQILKNFPGKDTPVDFNRVIFGEINTRARISDRAVTEAATVLSPRQLAVFRQLQRHWAAGDTRR